MSTQVNEYYINNPAMVLGHHSDEGTHYRRGGYTVKPFEGQDLRVLFRERIGGVPFDIESYLDAPKEPAQDRDFTPPPHTHKEGALYLDDAGELRRVESGSGVLLSEVETKLNDKDLAWLKDYVSLKERIKETQQAQLHDGDWEAALAGLDAEYAAFTKKHGKILAYTNAGSKNKAGEVTCYRRWKNKKRWRVDLEAPLAFALEDIREDGGIAKAPFLLGRTIKQPVRPQINCVADALAISLNEIGRLDLTHIAELYGVSVEQAVAELGERIYQTPTGEWLTADEYLSGFVIDKLEEAQAAVKLNPALQRNIDALLKVQPAPLPVTQITATLGANWIPPEVVEAFCEDVLGQSMDIRYTLEINQWSVENERRPSFRDAAADWGTGDRSPNEILSAALNNKTIKVTWKDKDNKIHVDEDGTAACNELKKKMQDTFRTWVWTDAKRAEALAAIYNRKFNCIAPRAFDGEWLSLPGLNLRYTLFPHQKRAVVRILQTGNTYLAHAVGAGKTLEMIVSGMEQKRLGLIRRPMFVVPNHMLEQFANEFMDAYPLAHIMVADKDHFGKDNRRRFMAQAALNNPDAIIITHSAFGLIGTKEETRREVARETIEQLEDALKYISVDDSDMRYTRAKLEKQKERLADLVAGKSNQDKKDQAVLFEDMGVDFLYLDEAHMFRKLDFMTEMDNIKGIDPKGSHMALDLYAKIGYLRNQNPQRCVVLASGTPVTNTMAELYTVMRYMDPEGLAKVGLEHFDAWADAFGGVVGELEPNAAGKYEYVERFAKFYNVPDLMSMVRRFMDVLTGDKLGELVQRPDLKGGVPHNVMTPAGAAVRAYLDGDLTARITRCKQWKPSREERFNPDPMINIITDGRLAAIDVRFVDYRADNEPDSKLNVMIDDIIATHHATADRVYTDPVSGKADKLKGACQLVFSAVGFGEQVSRRFDAKSWIKKRLTEGGIDAKQLAFMDEFKTDAKKEALFKDMRRGKVRILVGSPKNMGTGLNVQKRLVKLHYLSPPWYPADVEQPHGRILRQGNQNPEVEINWYATKGTYDSTMWGMVARKARFIEQAMYGDASVRCIEDISEASQYEMAAALAAGDERAIQLAGLNTEIERLTRLRDAHHQEQIRIKRDFHNSESEQRSKEGRLMTMRKAQAQLPNHVTPEYFRVTVDGAEFTKQGEAGAALMSKAVGEFMAWKPKGKEADASFDLGALGAAEFHLDASKYGRKYSAGLVMSVGAWEVHLENDLGFVKLKEVDPGGLMRRAVNAVNNLGRDITAAEYKIRDLERECERLSRKIGVTFEHETMLAEKVAEASELKAALAGAEESEQPLEAGMEAHTGFALVH